MAIHGGRFAHGGWWWQSAHGENLGQQDKRREEKKGAVRRVGWGKNEKIAKT